MHAAGTWNNETNRPLICVLEYGGVQTSGIAFLVSQGSPLLEFINNVISHIVEGGIFMHIRDRLLNKAKIVSKLDIPTPADTYCAISIRQLQTAFYLLMLGYVLAVVCFVTEIMWYHYRSKGHGPTGTSLLHGQT
jgi:rhodanese-related sulfurtransferase